MQRLVRSLIATNCAAARRRLQQRPRTNSHANKDTHTADAVDPNIGGSDAAYAGRGRERLNANPRAC